MQSVIAQPPTITTITITNNNIITVTKPASPSLSDAAPQSIHSSLTSPPPHHHTEHQTPRHPLIDQSDRR